MFMGLVQLNYKNKNLKTNKNLNYSHVQILVFSLPTLNCPKTWMKTLSIVSSNTWLALEETRNFKHKKLSQGLNKIN